MCIRDSSIDIPPLPHIILQPVLYLLIHPRMKNLPEYHTPLRRPRQQQLLEIPLGNHGNLGKLSVIQPNQLHNCLRHLFRDVYKRQS